MKRTHAEDISPFGVLFRSLCESSAIDVELVAVLDNLVLEQDLTKIGDRAVEVDKAAGPHGVQSLGARTPDDVYSDDGARHLCEGCLWFVNCGCC